MNTTDIIMETIGICIFATMIYSTIYTIVLISITKSTGLEFVNPNFLYDTGKVMGFGAYFLAIIFNLLNPLLAFFYWMYKLCTVGREHDYKRRI